MSPTPSTPSTEKEESEKMKESSTSNDRETANEEDKMLANAFFMGASLGHNSSAGVANENLPIAGNLDNPPCDGCERPYAGTMRCGRCESVHFCGRDCQVSHWSDGHKAECKHIKTVQRVLHDFKDARGWTNLVGNGAYKAAVNRGLHDKIREVLELEKVSIVERYRSASNGDQENLYSYTAQVMEMLFRRVDTAGLTTTSPTADSIDGLRIKEYVASHHDALGTWLQASVQYLRDVTDRATLRYPDLLRRVRQCTEKIWDLWVLVFTNALAARAIFTAFPFHAVGDATSGGESAELRRKLIEDHARETVKLLGEARRLVYNNWVSDSRIFRAVCLVCALVRVRTQEYGISIDVEGILNLSEDDKVAFQLLEVPMAKRTIAKGAMLDEQEATSTLGDAVHRLVEMHYA